MFDIKRHITKLLLIFALLCGGVGYAQTWPPHGMLGSGSESNPWQIRTAEELHALAVLVNESRANANWTRGQHFRLMNNIDLTDFLSGNPQGWLPIGRALDIKGNRRHAFQGHFHGGRRTISGLRINRYCDDELRPENFFIGLFGIIENATIDSLAVVVAEGDSVRGDNFTGILVGSAHWNNRIEQVSTEGKVVGQLFVGGLAGKLANSHITNCYSKANVYGASRHVGGLVGTMYFGGSITHSYAAGNVEGYVSVGGLIGYIRFENAEIRNTFVASNSILTRQAEGRQTAGRLVGHNFSSSTQHSNNFINSALILLNRNYYIDGKDATLEAFSDVNFFTNSENWHDNNAWDFQRVWGFEYDGVLPVFRWQIVPDPFLDTLFITEGAFIYPDFDPEVFVYYVFLPCGNGNFMDFWFDADYRLDLHIDVGNRAGHTRLHHPYSGLREGYVSNFNLTVTNELGRYETYRFIVHTPFDSTRIIKPYPNVLTVVNRPDLHGGELFLETGYRWFRDGQPLPGQYRGVLYLGRNQTVGSSRFSVEVTDISGTRNRVCPRSWDVEVMNLLVFPNPTDGLLTVQTANPEAPSRIEVFTICGRLVKIVNPTGDQTEVNLSGLQPGTYVVRQNGQTAIVIKQ